ncbi:VanZ family protein [bacterium]|nr:VanZ family protein [bacterium]
MGIIFLFSSKYFSAGNTSTVLYEWIHALFKSFSRQDFWTIHTYIRKSAHIMAYAVLAYFTLVAQLKSFYIFRFKVPKKFFFYAFTFCFSVAVLDEYNQSQISVRTGTYKDIIFDMIGVLLILIFVHFKTMHRQCKIFI